MRRLVGHRNNELAVVRFHLTLEAAVRRVILEPVNCVHSTGILDNSYLHVDHVLQVNERIVDGNHFDLVLFDSRTRNETTDAAKTAIAPRCQLISHHPSTHPLMPMRGLLMLTIVDEKKRRVSEASSLGCK